MKMMNENDEIMNVIIMEIMITILIRNYDDNDFIIFLIVYLLHCIINIKSLHYNNLFNYIN